MFAKFYTFSTSRSIFLSLLSCCLFLVLTSFNSDGTNLILEESSATISLEENTPRVFSLVYFRELVNADVALDEFKPFSVITNNESELDELRSYYSMINCAAVTSYNNSSCTLRQWCYEDGTYFDMGEILPGESRTIFPIVNAHVYLSDPNVSSGNSTLPQNFTTGVYNVDCNLEYSHTANFCPESMCNPTLTINNNGFCPVRIYWWKSSGDEYFTTLQPGDSWSVDTYDGHKWRAINTNHDWSNLLYDEDYMISGCNAQTWNLNPTYCDPPVLPEECPTPIINVSTNEICSGEAVSFSAEDLGFDCLDYVWSFGSNAVPSTATGLGPVSVVFSNSGSVNVSLTVVNDCDNGTPPSGNDCCEEHGDHNHASGLALRYVGSSSPVNIQVESEFQGDQTFYSATHQLDDLVIIQAVDRLGTNTDFSVGNLDFELHTSCSSGGIDIGHGINSNGELVDNPDPNSSSIIFIVEGISTPDGCSSGSGPGGGFGTGTFVCSSPCLDCEETTDITIQVSPCGPCGGTPCDNQCELNDHGVDGSASSTRLLWINLPGESPQVSRYAVVNNSSNFVENNDGTALITGTAENINDPSFQWQYNVRLINKRTWTEWSALGRSYKPGVAGSDHTSWSYYEVDNTNSYFTGLGGNAGESLTITHNPGDYEFGFQIGAGANVKNAAYGLSGWFKISGSYTGHGDFNGNLENCGDNGVCEDGSTPEITAPDDITIECTDSTDPADIGEPTLNCVTIASFPIVEWDLDACTSYSSNGTNLDFSEFTPTYPTGLSCGDVSATNVTRNSGQGHSCTYPRAGETGEAMCVSAKNSSSFNNNDDKAIRFSVTVDPTETTHLTALKFWELAPFEYSWIDGPSGTNNYPTKYGIRVLKNGTQIFKEVNILATNDWTLETFDFSGNADFEVTSTSTFSFELLGYDLIDNGANVAAWDVDDIQIEGGCSSSGGNSNITFTDVESGDCPKVITRTFEYTYDTNSSSSSCEEDNIVRYTMDECNDDGNYNSLGEFHATYPNNGGLTNVSATGFSSGEDAHSCTPGPQGVSGMCIPAHTSCTFNDNDDDILMFTVSVSPQNGDAGKISGLEFFEKAPLYAEYTYSNNNPLNNYPTKYGVRILKNGTEVFSSYDNPTTLGWTLESFDFSNDPDFSFTSNTTFEFHLIGYCTVGNGGSAQAWDLDDLKIFGGNCTTSTTTNTETITAVQTITVEDNNVPTFTNLPADLTVNCDENPPVIAPDFVDECDNDLEIVYEEEMQLGLCENNYSILRKWTATDDCGNSTTATQLVTFIDTTDPVLSDLPNNMTVECDAIPIPVILTATDNCDTDVLVSYNENKIDGSCENNYQLERIWIATDNCGNTVSHTQIITVTDQTPPVFEPLADVTLECSGDLTAPNPVANDNCDTDVTIVLNDESTTPGSCTDNYTITRIWIATDNCGNQSTLTQVTTVQDTQAPTIVVPADQTVSCDAIPAIPTPIVNDNCDNDVLVNFNEAFVPGTCDNNFTLIRTWNADDNCGNSETATQTITVIDSQGPEILDVPANVTVECDATPAPANPTASDNCDNDVIIEYQEISSQTTDGSCTDNSYTLTRIWTATDNCGNVDIEQQVITVEDTVDPVLSDAPSNVTVECDAVPAPATLTATDICDANVDIVYEEVRTDGNCEDNYTLTRTWTASDNCGNQDVEVQVITVQDTTDPELENVPSDIIVECNAVPAPAQPTAWDNCDADVTIDFQEVKTDGNCEDNYILTRTWTATDNCGNTDVEVQVITVQDTTDPNLYDVPSNITVECDAVPAVSTVPYADDNCDADVAITFAEVKVDGNCEDNYTLTRTWTATDNCGNTDVEVQVITVQDTTDPNLYDVPSNITVECDAVPAVSTVPYADDNCDADVAITFAEVKVDGNCEDNYTLTRTWTATDNCGNTDVEVQVITVQDTTDPNLYDVPSNITVECDAVPAVSTVPYADDNCDADVAITFAEVKVDGNCEDNYTLTRTWTATDNCGNTDVEVQVITVQDTTDPNLYDVPSNITVECDAVPAVSTVPYADDNCDADVAITFAEVKVDGNCEDNYTLTRTWTATDNCGNTDVEVQVITVQDTTDPNLYDVPSNITVECDAVPAVSTVPYADDNCDADVAITFAEVKVDGNCEDNYTLTRTWTATDNCGNTDVEVQVITVQDTTDPNLYDVPSNITVECDAVPAVSTAPYADDNCDADVAITFAEVKVDGNCEDNYTLTRTWTATDNCGNTDIQVQVITVQDTTDPELENVPGDITVECNAVPAPGQPTAWDNCDTDVTIDFQEVKTDGNCEDNYTLTRTWTATDNCGNTDVEVQVITVQDTTDPNLYDVPSNITVECDAVPAVSTAPYADDNCDADVAITFAEVKVDGNCEDNYTLTRTWTATDNCGNTDVEIQIITVQDTTDPELEGIPSDITVECSNVPVKGNPTAWDNCDTDVEITFVEIKTDGNCTDNYTLTRTWTATDNCGNTDVEVQVITVQDTTDPELFGVPSDVTVECDVIPAPAQPTASDNCDVDINIAFEVEIVPGTCPDSYLMIRKWTATDNCGNEDVQIQNIKVQDTTDPSLIGVPANVTVECNAVPTPANPTAEDNCDPNPIVTFNEVKIDGVCVDSYNLERTWTVTDACGNEYSETQIITVQDTTDPVMTGIPDDVTVECDLIPTPAQPFVNDNCDTDVDVDYSEVQTDGVCENTYTLTRTWVATDNCGNETTQVQTITVQDTTDPSLYGVPANITVQCDAIPLPALPTANDNCDTDVEISFLENILPGACTDNYTITRTWTATDNCGNETIGVQMITVEDTTDPVLSGVPGNITVECDAVPTPAQPTATDNCDAAVTIDYAEVRTDGSCLDTYTLTRTWTATDNCGNTDLEVQVIEVQDTSDPELENVPADITVECDAVPLPAQPTAWDNCDTDVTIDYAEVRTDGSCLDTYTLTRTWIATDNCGNTDVEVQVIEVQDTTDPILSGVPADATIECNAVPAPAQPTATDNCDTDVTISYNENITDGSCADNYTITRTWTATDNCGNSVSQTQILTVEDNMDPIISGVPTDVTVECDAVPAPAQPTATDNCDTDVDLDFTEIQTDGNCSDNYTLTRTWIATDNCGNTTTEIQVITIQDTTDPILSEIPGDITVECDAVPAPVQPTATDNCDTDVTIEFAEVKIDGSCADNYTLERTWTATDNCGNTDVEIQIITVQDTTDPILSGVPGNVTVECDAVPAPVQPTATDNCDTDVTIEFAEVKIDGNCANNYILERTWTATDNCGNLDIEVQTITVEDTTPPTISGVPADLIADCDDVPAAPSAGTIIVNDNCDTDVATTFSEIIQPGGCADSYIIKRIWTATDNCGNNTVATQNITVSDVTPPTLIGVPADLQVDCNSIPTTPIPGTVTATDNCDVNVYIQYYEELIDGPCDDSYVLKRTWTATDNCGNETQGTQIITVGDATGPVLAGVPSDVEVECNNIPTPANPTATDDCDTDVNISFVETTTPGSCENSYILTRTWIATDNCGNETVGFQNITVQDTQAPILTGIPTDVSVDCNSVPAPPAIVTATDNCDTSPQIFYNETNTPGACTDTYTLTRTWTAIDACGNESSKSQIIFVQDTQEPTIAGVPANVYDLPCVLVPEPAMPFVNDNCDYDVDLDFNEVSIPNDCGYTLTRTWTATDNCGNVATASQIITVVADAPVLSNLPADLEVECDNIPLPETVTATSNCLPNVQVNFVETIIDGGCADEYTIERTWTTNAGCGAEVSHTQTITVQDTTDPILTNIPANVTVDCNNIPTPAQPIATDNCDTYVDIDFSETSVANGCGYILTRTWTATDNCGNEKSVSQTITVEGDEPVLSSLPVDMTVECNNIPVAEVVTATSNCLSTVDVIFSENIIPGACENSYTIERTWSINASSACAIGVYHTQTIIVEDTQSPILAGIPANINVGCGNIPTPAQPVATDNCDTNVDIIFNEIQTPLPCGYELTRTWTATDNCGNETSASQNIIVEDNEDPILIGIPVDATVECNNIPPVATDITVTDNCSTNITIDFAETTTPGACTNAYTLTRTWTATDDCGNSISASQNITVEDNTPPTLIDVPANITVECSSIPGAPYVGATDNCDYEVVAILTEVETPLACGYLITRTWTATDDCGNESTATQEVTVADSTPPSLWEIPADLTVECGNIPAIDQGVGVLDNCDPNATLDFVESYIAGSCSENYTIVRTWTAADNCGNTVSDSQYITVQDTQAPVLAGIPTDLTVDCNNVPTPAQPVATDNCDPSVDIDFDEISVANGCGYILTRTWIATDNCGNVTEASQMITVNSDVPVLSDTPVDITVECNNIPPAATVTAQSNCAGTVQVDFVENIISGSCENSYTIERTWSLPSGCGNGISHTQLITVQDTQAPIMAGIPANLNVACGNVPLPAQPVATDNCDTDVEISFNENQNPLACGYELVRTWTATDNCGNETSASQTITVQDNDAPILIGVPADEVVNCGTVPNPVTVNASDNCDNDVDVSFSETSVVDGCQTIITRTWTGIDDCGNETSDSQTITINSDPATLSAMPSDFTVECSNVPAPADISAFDGCTGAPVQLDFAENIIPGDCENAYTIERTWSVSSGCGTGVSHTQYITVEDTTDPILIGIPADVEVSCGMIPTPPMVTGADNCDSDVDISFNEVETPAACGYILTRTWTATDNCGNEVSATQNINVGDNTPPIVAGIPANVTVECNNIPAVSNNPIATDNCDVDVEISFNETNTPGACADSYTLTRTWTAIDDCGNITEAVQTIFVQDITDPTLIGIPNNLIVDLNLGQTIPTPPNVIGTDNCDTDVEITFAENQTGSGCSYLLERIWTATDNCGNEVSATQTIEVIGGLNVTETHVDASCGENNGSIDLTVSGGVGSITFVWSNGAGNIEDQTDLAPGIYEVTVTDGTGCSANLSIEILGTGALQVDISASMVSCYEGNDGSINITMVNGLAPFTYDWTGGIGNVPNPTNLTAGSYNVTITDANGCSVSTGANVNQPQELTLTIDSNSGDCSGTLGSATAIVDGGTAPYQYAWNNGATTATINDLVAGTYTVTVTDDNGCTIEDEVTITASSSLIVSIDKTDVSCYLEIDGTATASAIGGQPDFTYLWSNGETNATIINLEAGSYTVTITDGIGCTGTQTIEIISPPELQLTTVSTEVTPIGNDGTATVTATGGTVPYQYIWSNGQMNSTATGLSVGTYYVTVIDDNGCFAIDQVEINSSVIIGDVNIGDYVWFDTNRDGIQDAGEIGFNNVMVKLLTAGLDGIFGTLDDEIVATETTSNNPSLTGAGYYLFENVLAGTYQIEFMSSSLPSDYMFTLENQGSDDNLDSDANPLTGRTPTFTVVAGQMDDLSFDAGVHPECNNVNTGGAIEATQTICAGDIPDLIVNSIYPIGGGGDLEYIWLSNTTGSPFSNTDPNWTILQGATDEFYQPGPIYLNTYFVRCARRAGCTNYTGETNIITILVTQLPSIGIEQAPSSLCVGEEGSFQAEYSGPTATYFWDFGVGASPQTSTQRNVYDVTYSSTGIKTVTLTVEKQGCSISMFYELEVINCLNNFEFTNFSAAATPNGTEVLLSWATRYEVNNSRYFLEHSMNGDDFQTFELRNANGSAQEFNSYQGVHAEPYYGVNYYRVKYVDANSEVTYSKVEVVIFDNGTRDIHVYPNPVVDFTYVEFLTELTEDATIEVVDMTGRVLHTKIVSDGFRTYRVSLEDYPAGTYLIWVRYNDYRKDVERVVKITE